MQPTSPQPDLPGLDLIHRTAVRLGAAAGGLTTVVFALLAVVHQDPEFLRSTIGPAALTAFCLVMIRRGRERGEVVLLFALVSTALSYRLFGMETSAAPAAIGVVVVISVGVLFVSRHMQWAYVAAGTACLFLVGPFLMGWNNEATWVGVSAAASGSAAMALFIVMRDAAVSMDRRYRLFVERMPVPLIEQDWSMIRQWVQDCKLRGVTDMKAHLAANPGVIDIMAPSIQLRGVNPATIKMTEHTGITDIKQMRTAVGMSQFHDFIRREIISMFNGTPPEASDHKVVLPDGTEVWTRFHGAELDDAGIPGVDRVTTSMDITELKQAQSRLADLVRSKDEFVAAVSHELRTPLTSVLGFAELLLTDDSTLSPEDQEMLAHLQTQARDMSHIVEDLLVAARADIGTVSIDTQPIELTDVVTETAANMASGFSVHLGADPMVKADRVRVGQILRNLMTNASRYGGEDRSIHVSRTETAGVVEVRDNGDGISFEERERIFEPYTRAHDRPGMTASVGLGLAVSRQLAGLMGGSLDYHGDHGHSVFRLTLPLATAVEATGEEVA